MPFVNNNNIRISTCILSVYLLLLPVSTALAGMIGSISILNYIAVAYIITGFIEIVSKGTIIIHEETRPIVLYFAYSLITCLWNQDFSISFYFTTFATSFLIIVVALFRSYSNAELKIIYISFLFSTFTVLTATALNYHNRDDAGRLIVTLSSTMDPNDFGCGTCVIISALLICFVKNKSLLALIGLIGISEAILLTGSRGALLMLVAEIGVGLLLIVRNNKTKALLVLIIAITLATVLFSVLPADLTSRFSIANVVSGGGSGRLGIWEAAINTFSESSIIHKLFGYGHGTFRSAVNYYGSGRFYTYESHNMFINALIEGGVLGVTLLVNAFIKSFACALKDGNSFGLIALSGFMITGLTLDTQSYRIFPIVFITVIAFSNRHCQPTAAK